MHEKVKCVQCHVKPVFTNVGKNCADCHADIHRRQMGSNCEQCHTVLGWDIAVQQVKDHQNRFPLFGAHAAVPCEECHKQAATGQFLGLSTECNSCHLKDWQNTTNPAHASAGPAFASSNCQGCHSFDSWLGAKFDHSTTGFLLTNGHANVPCSSCHVNNNYNLTSGACQNCHMTQYSQTNNPTHTTAGPAFSAANCATCHNTVNWTTAIFDHSTTGFPLTNGHANVPCATCHVNNNYNLTSGACQNCHMTQYNQTNNPTHSTSGPVFAAANCATCHNTVSWTTAIFDHSATGFPLTNGHANVPCASCHINNNYNLTSGACQNCHMTEYNQTNNPPHSTSGAQFQPQNCSTCHNTIAWADITSFNHASTGFALVGTHMSPTPTACAACHVNNNYNITTADCMSCHQSAWNSTQTLGGNVPNHVAANFPTTASACSTCHSITVWANGVFDHSTTGFPLTNSHQLAPAGKVTACTQCHVGGNYNLTSANTDCYGCHQTDWTSTQTMGGNVPNHVSAGFPTALCSQCHDTITWTDSTFNHNTTGFALVGTHATTPCAQCHVNGNYSLTSANTDCMSCHQTAWNTTQTLGGNVPNHVAANFPTTASACSTCHSITVWANGVFDHSTTGFPLTNSHQMAPAGKVAACTQCHVGGNYALTSANTDCYGCHQTDWTSTQTMGGSVPNHVSAGFPTSLCSQCHDTITWLDSTFNHANTGFALVGTHATTPCAQCHVSNNYSLTSANTDCMSCHTAAFNSTNPPPSSSVPNHVTANFPTTAAACSGCHTITVWADGKFDHSTTGWPLTGGHIVPTPNGGVQACTDCHVGGNYTLTAANTACYGCHITQWTSTQTLGGTVPNHIAAGYPQTCDTCHTTSSWLGATFNHTYFPIPHHGSVCNDCHQVSTNYASFTCINCHTQTAHQQTQTNNQHQGVGGYTYGPTTCYNCHKNGGGG